MVQFITFMAKRRYSLPVSALVEYLKLVTIGACRQDGVDISLTKES
jgi:hypothetical protein